VYDITGGGKALLASTQHAVGLPRASEIDVLTCPWCGGERMRIARITDGRVVRAILDHLGLSTAAPVLAPARSPPGFEFAG
jgi:hypothetical protein